MANYPRILVIDPEADSRAEVQRLLIESRYIVVGGVGYDDEAAAVASQFKPQVVLIAYQDPLPVALRAIQAVKEAAAEAHIIAYSHLTDVQSVRRAILAGAWDYLARPLNLKDLSASIELGLQPALDQGGAAEPVKAPLLIPLARPGTVITVFSAKGGVGRSVLAVNLAAALAETGRSTALVDLDSVFGDVARMTRLRSEKSFLEAIREVEDLDETNVSSRLVQHVSGVHILPAPASPTDWREIDPAATMRLLGILSRTYGAVVIDTPATFTDLVVVALERADTVPVLTSLDPISVEATRPVLEMLSSSLHSDEKMAPTANHIRPASLLTEADVAEQLGRPVTWVLPYDQHAAYRDEEGRPLVLCRPTTRLSRTIEEIAASITGVAPASVVAYSPPSSNDNGSEAGESSSLLQRVVKLLGT